MVARLLHLDGKRKCLAIKVMRKEFVENAIVKGPWGAISGEVELQTLKKLGCGFKSIRRQNIQIKTPWPCHLVQQAAALLDRHSASLLFVVSQRVKRIHPARMRAKFNDQAHFHFSLFSQLAAMPVLINYLVGIVKTHENEPLTQRELDLTNKVVALLWELLVVSNDVAKEREIW